MYLPPALFVSLFTRMDEGTNCPNDRRVRSHFAKGREGGGGRAQPACAPTKQQSAAAPGEGS